MSKVRLTLIICLLTFVSEVIFARSSEGAPAQSEQCNAIKVTQKVPGVFVKNAHWTRKMKEIAYPQYIGGDPTACAKLNSAMRGFVRRNVAVNYGDLYEWNLENTFVSPKAVSAKFSVSTFGEGAAHSINRFESFNYRVQPSVTQLSLNDLFGKKVDYKMLSPICQKFIVKDLYKDGEKPDEQYTASNYPPADIFSGFSFDNKGVTFAFNMSCEAMNGYNVKVPYSSLKPLFVPASPIFALAMPSVPSKKH
jgi:hypothetical protein